MRGEITWLHDRLNTFTAASQAQQAEITRLRTRLETAKGEFRKLRTERDMWRNGNDTVTALLYKVGQERDALKRQLALAEHRIDLLRSLSDRSRWCAEPLASTRGASREELTQILALAHPDKWHGQPATALAHEVSVALNSLRDQLEVRP